MSKYTPEEEATMRDKSLAWELFDFQPQNPLIAELCQSVLAREPSFTGMRILLAQHREACGEVEEARRGLQTLMATRDRQFVNAARSLRDLEKRARNFAESVDLAELVLRESADAHWGDVMDLGEALSFAKSPAEGWRKVDEAVALCAETDPDNYSEALSLRASHLLVSGASAATILRAAEEAIAADPTDSFMAMVLAYAYTFHYRGEEAEPVLLRALRENPTDESAQAALRYVRSMIEPIREGLITEAELRDLGLGELSWLTWREQMLEISPSHALAELDAVMPADLEHSLRPALSSEAAIDAPGEAVITTWHDGQQEETGALWQFTKPYRLLSSQEVADMRAEIEADPSAWTGWAGDGADYLAVVMTDDAGTYLITGHGGRLFARGRDGAPDQEIAPSLADWLWDRVAAFGGVDRRPPTV